MTEEDRTRDYTYEPKDMLLKNFVNYAFSDDKERERFYEVVDDFLESEEE